MTAEYYRALRDLWADHEIDSFEAPITRTAMWDSLNQLYWEQFWTENGP